MITNMVRLSRRIALFIRDECPFLELLPHGAHRSDMEDVFTIVLFRAKDDHLNDQLVAKINETRKIYVSGTQWEGKAAARFAVAKMGCRRR